MKDYSAQLCAYGLIAVWGLILLLIAILPAKKKGPPKRRARKEIIPD